MKNPTPWALTDRGVTLFIRVTPNAFKDCIEGIEIRDNGQPVLKMRVRAVPDKGKANKAVIALLAKTLSCPKSDFEILAGETARQKTLLLTGERTALVKQLSAFDHIASAHSNTG